MIIVRSTTNCPNTPRILFGLEELGLPYTMERAPDGEFARDWGSPGPTITDGDVTTIEPGAILRHLSRRAGTLWPSSLAQQAEADRWLEFQGRRISSAVEKREVDTVLRLMGFVEARVATSTWLLGDDFTMVDVYYSLFAHPKARQMQPFLAPLAALSAYLDRIAARPAFARSLAVAAQNLT